MCGGGLKSLLQKKMPQNLRYLSMFYAAILAFAALYSYICRKICGIIGQKL